MTNSFKIVLLSSFLLLTEYMFALQVTPPEIDTDDSGAGSSIAASVPSSGLIILLILGSIIGIWYFSKQRQNS